MYPAKAGSPQTMLTAEITNDATSITVEDPTVLPAAPNICVIGEEANAEIIAYTSISGNTVSGLSRGLGGTTPQAWVAGTAVARNFTSFDHDTFKANIEALEASKAEASNVYSKSEADVLLADKSNTSHTHDGRYYTESEVDNKLSVKANLASPALTGTPTAPTAASGTNTTQIATTAFVQSGLNGKAASSHTHSAGDIASGTLSTARGGTGNANGTVAQLTTARTVRTNLASTSTASFDGSANITPGVTGTLPIANGGTGNTTGLAASATKLATGRSIRVNLANTYDSSNPVTYDGTAAIAIPVGGVLPVDHGGTNASTVTGNPGAVHTLFPTNLGSTSKYVATFTGSWASTGYAALPLAVALGGTGYGDSGEKTITNSSVFSGTIRYRRIGQMLYIWNTSALKLAAELTGNYVTLCTLPEAYRDVNATRGNAVVANSMIPVSVTYSSSGNVSLYRGKQDSITTSNNIYISIMVMVTA